MNIHEHPHGGCVTKIATTTPLAARPHTCTLCERPIPIGERHKRLVYRDEHGDLHFVRLHLRCPPGVQP